MNKQEFEELVGEKVYEWETIEFVYTYHPSINNVGGKKQIADVYKGHYMSGIRKMVPDAIIQARKEGYEVKHVIEKLSEFDVVAGMCYNLHGRPMRWLYSELVNVLGKNEPDEYFRLAREWEGKEFPYSKRIAVYCVPGGSEGTYLHIDVIDDEKISNIILGKTLADGKGSIEAMYKTAGICAEFLQQD